VLNPNPSFSYCFGVWFNLGADRRVRTFFWRISATTFIADSRRYFRKFALFMNRYITAMLFNNNNSLYSGFRLIAFFLISVTMLTSCNDDEEQVVPEIEIAQTILSSLSPKGAGVVDQFQQAAYAADITKIYCGMSFDSTIHKVRTDANFIHDYLVIWNWQVQCVAENADTVKSDYTSEGFYENARLRSNDVSDGSVAVSQFNESSPYYAIAGSIFRVGTQQMKVREKMNFSSAITYTFTQVLLNKNDFEIAGGSMTVSITGSKNTEGDYRYDGTITFGANKTATLVLNSGEVYQGDW
jgi:hypothetical protein